METTETQENGIGSESLNKVLLVKTENSEEEPEKLSLRETIKRLTRSQVLCLIGLAFGNFSVGTCVSLQAPFFPAQAEKKGATAAQYGFVFGVYQVSIFLFAQVFGKLVGCIQPYLISTFGIAVVGASSVLFGLLDKVPNESFIPLAIVIRLFEGVGSVAIKTASYAIVGVHFEKDVTTVFGLLETCFGVGLIVGPAIGGLLFQIGGYMVPFVVVGCLLLMDSLLVFFVLPRNCGEVKSPAQLWRFWKHPPILISVITVLSISVYIGVLQAALEPHLRKFNLTPFLLGCIFIVCGASFAIFAPIWGRLCDKGVNPLIFLFSGCTIALISHSITGPLPFIPVETKIWMVIIGVSLLGVCGSLKQVSTFVLCVRQTLDRGFPKDVTTYGLIASMFSTGQSIGAFIGPTAGGYFLDLIGFRWTLVIVMGNELILIMVLTMFYFCCRVSRKTLTETTPLIKSGTHASKSHNESFVSVIESSFSKNVICQP